MDYTKLVDLYLEGELTSVEKELLFKELAQNESLRVYLEEQLKFNQLIQKDLQSISVPSDVTNSIFASLNFSIPNEAALPRPPFEITFWGNIKQFLLKYVPYFASSIVGGVVTFLLLWNLLPIGNQTNNSYQMNLSNEQGVPLGVATEVPKIAAHEESLSRNANFEKIIRETLDKWLSKYFNNFNNLNIAESREPQKSELITTNALPEIEPSPFEPAKRNILGNNFLTKTDLSIVPSSYGNLMITSQNNTSVFSQKLRNITLGFRGYMLKSEPEVNVNLAEKGILSNSGFSIGYNISKNTNIGFEFGQEKFAQKYTLRRDGEITYYKQNPLLWWYGLYLQQSISNIFQIKELRPMARIFIGGTPVGPLARGMLGFQYTPDERVNLYLGWEGAILGYKVQNEIYKTKKSGITYGVSVKY